MDKQELFGKYRSRLMDDFDSTALEEYHREAALMGLSQDEADGMFFNAMLENLKKPESLPDEAADDPSVALMNKARNIAVILGLVVVAIFIFVAIPTMDLKGADRFNNLVTLVFVSLGIFTMVLFLKGPIYKLLENLQFATSMAEAAQNRKYRWTCLPCGLQYAYDGKKKAECPRCGRTMIKVFTG